METATRSNTSRSRVIRRALAAVGLAALATLTVGSPAQAAPEDPNLAIKVAATQVSDEATITVGVTNTSALWLPGAKVAVTLPAGFKLVTAEPAAGEWSGGTWGLPFKLEPGGISTLTLTGTFTATPGQPVTGTAALYCTCDESDLSDNAAKFTLVASGVEPTNVVPDLVLTVALDNARPSQGELATITYSLKNNGANPANGPVVVAPVPNGLTLQSSTPNPGGTYDSAIGRWEIGSRLAVGEMVQLVIMARVDAEPGTGIWQRADASCLCEEIELSNNSAQYEFSVSKLPSPPPSGIDLAIAVAQSTDHTTVGAPVAHSIVITNRGPETATTIKVKINVPAGITIRATASGSRFDAATGQWTVPELKPSDAAGIAFTGQVDQPGIYTITAEVMHADQKDSDSTPANGVNAEDDFGTATLVAGANETPPAPPVADDTRVTPADAPGNAVHQAPAPAHTPARVRIRVQGPSQVHQGQVTTYRLTIWNPGSTIARSVRLTSPVPANASLVGLPPGAHLSRGRLVWNVGTLTPGARRTYRVMVRVDRTATGSQLLTGRIAGANFTPARGRTRSIVILGTAFQPGAVPVTG